MNEYDSGKYDVPSNHYDSVGGENMTIGELILRNTGFVDNDGDPYKFEWAGYSVLFSLLICFISIILASIASVKVRFETGKSLVSSRSDEEERQDKDKESSVVETVLPFQKVNMTFKDIHYTVNSSIGKEKIELLKGIDGVIEAGKMTALVSYSLSDSL